MEKKYKIKYLPLFYNDLDQSTVKDNIMEVRRILYSRRNFDKLV